MLLTPFAKLPKIMQNDAVAKYHALLKKRKATLVAKRLFDIVMASILIILLMPVFMLIAGAIFAFDGNDVIFKQQRITKDYKAFTIYKFRTMKKDIDIKNKVTSKHDARITPIGKYLRKTRLDELPQLFNVLKGEMSFVGTRPEVPEYVKLYDNEMLATLLLPAGITSFASIEYKNEAELLNGVNIDDIYINKILPEKMKINLKYLNDISILQDIKIMLKTII